MKKKEYSYKKSDHQKYTALQELDSVNQLRARHGMKLLTIEDLKNSAYYKRQKEEKRIRLPVTK